MGPKAYFTKQHTAKSSTTATYKDANRDHRPPANSTCIIPITYEFIAD
jgi:hypothetical protein